MHEESLTGERLKKQFKNNFNLCNFSIRVGRELIAAEPGIGLQAVLEAVGERVEEANELDRKSSSNLSSNL